MEPHSQAILLKISVITGWSNPDDKSMLAILTEQLSKHLQESYPTVNPVEVDFAFRQYASTVKDWGKNLNLVLFDQVMNLYMASRREASLLEQNYHKPPVALIEAPKMSSAQIVQLARELWEKMRKVDLVHMDAFKVLVAEKLIQYPMDKIVQARYWKRAEYRMKEFENDDPRYFARRDRKELTKAYARKLVVADYFDGTLEED